jgi:hypothetical protein
MAGNQVGTLLVEGRGEPWEASMSYLVRSEGSGFVAGSLGAIVMLIAVFMLVMALAA